MKLVEINIFLFSLLRNCIKTVERKHLFRIKKNFEIKIKTITALIMGCKNVLFQKTFVNFERNCEKNKPYVMDSIRFGIDIKHQ